MTKRKEPNIDAAAFFAGLGAADGPPHPGQRWLRTVRRLVERAQEHVAEPIVLPAGRWPEFVAALLGADRWWWRRVRIDPDALHALMKTPAGADPEE